MKSKYLPHGNFFGSEWYDEDELRAVSNVIKSKSLFRYYGSNMQFIADDFENDLKDYFNVDYSLVVSSGTAAIKCAIKSLGIGFGDEVLVPVYGFIATANAVSTTGATPIFVDLEPNSLSMDMDDAQKKITEKTKGIICVDLFGKVCDRNKILNLCKKNKIFFIEDIAQSYGAQYRDKKVGLFGDVSCLSFQANKLISTGEGGAIILDKKTLYDKAKIYHDQGGYRENGSFPRWDHPMSMVGENLRMSEIHAAIGREQVKKLSKMLDILRERSLKISNILKIFNFNFLTNFDNNSKDTGITNIILIEDIDVRSRFLEKLKEKNLSVSLYYNEILTDNNIYSQSPSSFPNAKKLSQQILGFNTPLSLSDTEFEEYLKILRRSILNIFEDKDSLFKNIYNRNSDYVIKKNNLNCMRKNYLPNNYLVESDSDKIIPNVIVGGPCIDRYTSKQLKDIKLSFYIDIITPLYESIKKETRCCIYLDTPIEQANTLKEKKEWKIFSDKIESFIEKTAKIFKQDKIIIIRRDNPKITCTLDKMEDIYDNKESLYNLIPSSNHINLEWQYLHGNRVIKAYSPLFIKNLLINRGYYEDNKENFSVLVIEAVSQLKAIDYARKYYNFIDYKLYVDMPSASGKNRLYRSLTDTTNIFSKKEEYSELQKKYISMAFDSQLLEYLNFNNCFEFIDFLNKLIKKTFI